MASLGEYLSGIATGLERAVGVTGQALGNVSRIMQMQQIAEAIRRQRELWPYELEKAKAEGALAKAQREQTETLLKPIPLTQRQSAVGSEVQQSIEQTVQPTTQVTAEAVIQAGIQQSQVAQNIQPIPVKDIEISGVVPITTIQTILQDPFLSSIAVDYDENGRPYTNLMRLQALDKVLNSTQAIEAGLTEKVTKATIQGLLAEEDKTLQELAKLQENPAKNQAKINALQQKLGMIRQRMRIANQSLLLSDMKLYKDYMMNYERLDQQRALKLAELEAKLIQMLGEAEVKRLQAQIAEEKANLETIKLQTMIAQHGGVHKVEKLNATLKDGRTIPVEKVYYKDGHQELRGPFGPIDPSQIEKIEWARKPELLDIVLPEDIRSKLEKTAPKKSEEPKGTFERAPDGSLIFRK